MRKVEFGSLSDNTETIVLFEKASRLLESPAGQKILREISAFDALAHSDKAWVGPLKGRERILLTTIRNILIGLASLSFTPLHILLKTTFY